MLNTGDRRRDKAPGDDEGGLNVLHCLVRETQSLSNGAAKERSFAFSPSEYVKNIRTLLCFSRRSIKQSEKCFQVLTRSQASQTRPQYSKEERSSPFGCRMPHPARTTTAVRTGTGPTPTRTTAGPYRSSRRSGTE